MSCGRSPSRWTTAPGGEWDEREAWSHVGYTQVSQGPSGSPQAPFDSFMEPHRRGQALEENGQSGWGEWLYGEGSDSAYYLLTMNTTRQLEEESGQTLQLYFSKAVDGVPATDEEPGGTLLSFPVENVLREVTVPLDDGPWLSLSVSPVSIALDTSLTTEEWGRRAWNSARSWSCSIRTGRNGSWTRRNSLEPTGGSWPQM